MRENEITFAAEAMLQIINAKIWKFWISIFNIFKSVNTLLSDNNPVHPRIYHLKWNYSD